MATEHRREHIRTDMKITPHFTWGEYACRCGTCEIQLLDNRLIPMLEELRSRMNDTPIKITSGYRCPAHNLKVGGSSKSQHMNGKAVDILIPEQFKPADVAEVADHIGFNGIGVYEGWLHLDVRDTPARWSG